MSLKKKSKRPFYYQKNKNFKAAILIKQRQLYSLIGYLLH